MTARERFAAGSAPRGCPIRFKTGPVTIGAGQVMFVFQNAVGVQSSITDVYFQDGTLLGIWGVYESTGVYYVTPASPQDLPGGHNITPNFATTRYFSADTISGLIPNGVDASNDALGILFTLQTNLNTGQPYSVSDVVAAIATGFNSPSAVWNNKGTDKTGGPLGLRIGIEVQGFASGAIEGYVNTNSLPAGPSSVNRAPPSAVLLTIRMLLFGCIAWWGRGSFAAVA
jgi:hypothetical protein